jgi:hypothetical protein
MLFHHAANKAAQFLGFDESGVLSDAGASLTQCNSCYSIAKAFCKGALGPLELGVALAGRAFQGFASLRPCGLNPSNP